MKTTMTFTTQLFLLACIFSTVACNNTSEPSKAKDHVMKGKFETIKKAEAVDQLIQDAAAKQRRMIDEQSE